MTTYHEEEAAILLQSSKKTKEGHTGDDDASDDQHVARRQVGSQCLYVEAHQQVNAQTEHGHTADLGRKYFRWLKKTTKKNDREELKCEALLGNQRSNLSVLAAYSQEAHKKAW